MTTIYKNTQIFYTSQGSGNPLILLHGFLESEKVWEYFLKDYEGKRQLITIDLPGHGQSGCLGEIHSMEEMAAVVHHVLEVLSIQKADFLGHSMGGYVALAFLEENPEMVNKFILLNSTPAEDSEERKHNRERSIEIVQKSKEAFVSMAITNLLTPENSKKFKEKLDLLKEEAKKFPTEGITAALKGMKIRTNRISLLKNFRGSKIILAGEKDPILDFEEMKNIATATDCSFYSFPDGHLIMIENREEFLKTVYFIE